MSKIKFRIPFDGDIVISSRYAMRDDLHNPRVCIVWVKSP